MPEEGRTRRCLASGEIRPRETLVRFVVSPDGALVADIDGVLPGRGFWVGAERELIERAVKRQLFAKAARAAGQAPPRVDADLASKVESGLARRCIEAIGLARRAGEAACGHDKVAEWIAGGRVGLLLEASDGAAQGRAALRARAAGVPVMDTLRAVELAQAFGREHVVHGALAPGALARRLAATARRLVGVRRADKDKMDREVG